MTDDREQNAEVVVLGAGVAGYPCAIRLAQLGKKVIVIDRAEIGGVCLNRGCIPSKALISGGTLFHRLSHASEMGIEVNGAKLDLSKLIEWKDSVVKKLTSGVSMLLKANGCTVIQGDARFLSDKALEVATADGKLKVNFQNCVVATGSRVTALRGFEVDQKQIVDSTGALSLRKRPESMVCIGGGYIGLELGMFYAKIGTKVTVVEAMSSLLAGVDAELVQVVRKKLEKLGVEVLTDTRVLGHKKQKNGVVVTVSGKNGERNLDCDAVLVTIGRTPNSDGFGLDKAGIQVDSKGFIPVDPQRRTRVSHIFAIGDVAGQPLLAHKGTKEGLVAADAIAGKKTIYDVIAMPAVIFTDPEIATVGLTEAEAKAKGHEPKIGLFPFAANGRALSMGEPDGMVKMVADAKTGKLLGVHVVGPEASNLISEAALALEMGAYVEDLALTVHPHPTLGEVLMEAAEATLGHPIHIYQRKPRERSGASTSPATS